MVIAEGIAALTAYYKAEMCGQLSTKQVGRNSVCFICIKFPPSPGHCMKNLPISTFRVLTFS